MHRTIILPSIVSAIALFAASPALATDLLAPVETPAAPTAGMAGYIELNAAGYFGHEEYDDDPDYYSDWNSVGLNGAARVTIPVADPIILQLDAWGSTWSGNHTYCDPGCNDWDYSGVQGGVAAHFAYQMNGMLLGGLVSVGGESDDFWSDTSSVWATGALEAVANMGNMRVYGQAGVSKAISGDDADDGDLDLFAQGVLAYYIDPNLAVSVNLGFDHWSSENYNGSENDVTFGARLEKKFEGTPVSAYLAYQGTVWDGEDDYDSWSGVSHAILVGVRFAFGDSGETLQDLNDSVGLVDMNHVYGDFPH